MYMYMHIHHMYKHTKMKRKRTGIIQEIKKWLSAQYLTHKNEDLNFISITHIQVKPRREI